MPDPIKFDSKNIELPPVKHKTKLINNKLKIGDVKIEKISDVVRPKNK